MYSKLSDQATGFLYPLSLYFNKLEAFCLYLQYIKGPAVKKPTQAALLSGLVFPGLGHFFLKKRIAAAIFGIGDMAKDHLFHLSFHRRELISAFSQCEIFDEKSF